MTHQKHNEFEERAYAITLKAVTKFAGDKGSVSTGDIETIAKDIEEAIREAQIPESRISQLRQWINEKPKDRLVTNEDIKVWLYGEIEGR